MGQQGSKVIVTEGHLEKFGKVEYLIPEQPAQPPSMRVSFEVSKEPEDLREWKEKVQKLRKNAELCQFIVLPLQIKQNSCLVCTNANKMRSLTIYYEKLNLSLFQIIKNRRHFKKYFSEAELWYLLYVLLKVSSHFQQHSDYLGNIHTTNILLNDNSRIRLFTLLSSPSELQNITRIRQSRHMDTFIAPEEIRFIHEDSFACINDCNRNKVDLFNIGLVLLSTLMLKDCYHIYARTLFQLNEEKLSATIQEMKATHLNIRYSADLLDLIQAFLIFDPKVRKTPKYYYEILKKNEVKILELQKFQPEIQLKKEQSNGVQPSPSPEVIHYLQKTSPNTRQGKYLSLAKNKTFKKSEQSANVLEGQGLENGKQDNKLTRRLFNE